MQFQISQFVYYTYFRRQTLWWRKYLKAQRKAKRSPVTMVINLQQFSEEFQILTRMSRDKNGCFVRNKLVDKHNKL